MKRSKQFAILGIISLLAIITVLSVALVQTNISSPSAAESDATINYHSNVCIYKNGELVGPCSHNVLYTNGGNGSEYIEQSLGVGGTVTPALNISLCNATAGCGTPVAAGTEVFNRYTSCGLQATNGAYASLGVGNWSVANTFTATCDGLLTNTTRLMAGPTTLFAGNSFTLVTLQTNDQLTINWTIWVT